jgi:hypothetical protein
MKHKCITSPKIQLVWTCAYRSCAEIITHQLTEKAEIGYDVLMLCEQHFNTWKKAHPKIKLEEETDVKSSSISRSSSL